jgi:CRISPR-associated exonuclease Cas4
VDDRELLPLSLLSQLIYCPRRAALLTNERVWLENADTAKGRAEHERVHIQHIERRKDEIKIYEFEVFSQKLSITGKCDCLEARRDSHGCLIPAVDYPVSLYPVEYKHGAARREASYEIQLCAQAICLEEMFSATIDEGAVFYITAHRRQKVQLTEKLRESVKEAARSLESIRKTFYIPAAV